jgi:hypothetical protein
MKRVLHISLDETGLGKIIIIDGEREIDISAYTCGFGIQNHSGGIPFVMMYLVPMALEMDLPVELRAAFDEELKESEDDSAADQPR